MFDRCTTSQAISYKIPHDRSQLLLRTLSERLLSVDQDTPSLCTPSPVSEATDRSTRELPLSVRQLIRAKTARLQPHSLDARIASLFQHLFRHRRRRNDAQARLARLLQL
jgi:hypothetical protein